MDSVITNSILQFLLNKLGCEYYKAYSSTIFAMMEHAFFCHVSEGDFSNALNLLEFALNHRIYSFKRSIIVTLIYDFIWFQKNAEIISGSMSILSSPYLLEHHALLQTCLESDIENHMDFPSSESLAIFQKDRKLLHMGNVFTSLAILESFFGSSWTGRRYETRCDYDIFRKVTNSLND